MAENKIEKSLRWIVNQIPDVEPEGDIEKMLLTIKYYCQAGADEIKRLETEVAYEAHKETAKEILQYVGNLYDDCDQRFRLKDYQWHKNLCKKYGVEV